MTSSIPDSISKDDLLALQVNAEPDFVPAEETGMYDGLTQSQVEELAFNTLKEAHAICSDPMLSKVLMLSLAHSWIEMHSIMALDAMKDEEHVCALHIARDGGKCQDLYQIVHSISFPNDFTVPDED